MLIFSSLHLYFSCREANASCGGREPRLKPRTIGMYQSRVNGVSTISGLQRMYPVVKTWDRVVDEYSRRLLGFPGDKLLAISAMAASLVRMARDERRLESRYCAGLIFDLGGKDWGWEGELLWAVTRPATLLGTTGGAFTPSWSWASVEAPIHRWQAVVSNLPEDGIRLLDIHAPLADERNPYGAVKGGYVKLLARTRPFSTIDTAEMHLVITRNTNIGDDTYNASTQSALVVRPDTAEVDDMIARGGEGLTMVELVAARTNNKLRPTYPAGILIMTNTRKPPEGPSEDGYQRIGIFEFQIRNVSSSDVQHQALKRSQTLFENRDLQELRIV
ncbi:hypothetical protein ONZ43_g4442 [Nemania bipapillata]|uniref:Uncharacterized protein n=1 Tax=Nemania bipapillata TaxID=110536 RepID=A0ACC2IMS8_9PEZI|nr:hypothetical protein ONZ43_g4442 [Nemania bipapillata]